MSEWDQEDVIRNIPDAKGEKSKAQPASPGAAREETNRQQHEHGGEFAGEFRNRQVGEIRQRVGLIRIEAVHHGAKVKDDCGFQVAHSQGEESYDGVAASG